jgi:Ca2+-binding EF-hand superfamily protein
LPALLALGLAGALGVAQERGRRGGGMPRPTVLWNALDTDHDGVLSAAEMAAAPAALRTLDKNGDGRLTLDEVRPMAAGRGEETRGDGGADNVEETVKTLMALFDANGDGKLQKSEVPERMQGMFERGDTNHDGVLTIDEIRTLARGEARSQTETRPQGPPGGMMRMVDPVFFALDANHDNVITSNEIDNAPAVLRALDANHDGVLTQDEVRGVFGAAGRGPGRE